MSKKIFINLPVKDLGKSMAFYSRLGFANNPQFTDEKAACMVVSEDIYCMLLVKSFFKTFTDREIADTTQTTEVINSLMLDSRAAVDDLAEKAYRAGAADFRPVQDFGFMYGRSFKDLDGHIWEAGYMDPSHINGEGI